LTNYIQDKTIVYYWSAVLYCFFLQCYTNCVVLVYTIIATCISHCHVWADSSYTLFSRPVILWLWTVSLSLWKTSKCIKSRKNQRNGLTASMFASQLSIRHWPQPTAVLKLFKRAGWFFLVVAIMLLLKITHRLLNVWIVIIVDPIKYNVLKSNIPQTQFPTFFNFIESVHKSYRAVTGFHSQLTSVQLFVQLKLKGIQ